jgi:hypothetical protein
MYNDTQQAVQRPVLRILPKTPRPWRLAWREAVARAEQAKGVN